MPAKNIKRQWGGQETDAIRQVVEALGRFGTESIDVGNIAAGAVVAATAALPAGTAAAGDPVIVGAKNPNDGLVVGSAEITAADVLTVRLLNTTAGAINPSALDFYYFVPTAFAVL